MMKEHKVAEEAAMVTSLAEAVRLDGTGTFRDEALLDSIATARIPREPFARLKTAAILIGLARRIEFSAGEYPNLIEAAAGLTPEHGGEE